jgi:hypothetical protein
MARDRHSDRIARTPRLALISRASQRGYPGGYAPPRAGLLQVGDRPAPGRSHGKRPHEIGSTRQRLPLGQLAGVGLLQQRRGYLPVWRPLGLVECLQVDGQARRGPSRYFLRSAPSGQDAGGDLLLTGYRHVAFLGRSRPALRVRDHRCGWRFFLDGHNDGDLDGHSRSGGGRHHGGVVLAWAYAFPAARAVQLGVQGAGLSRVRDLLPARLPRTRSRSCSWSSSSPAGLARSKGLRPSSASTTGPGARAGQQARFGFHGPAFWLREQGDTSEEGRDAGDPNSVGYGHAVRKRRGESAGPEGHHALARWWPVGSASGASPRRGAEDPRDEPWKP